MVDARQGSGGFSVSASGTLYWPAGMSYFSGSGYTTESNTQVTYRTAGVMKNLFVYISAFTSTGSITLRDSAVGSTTLTVTPTSSLGAFENTTNIISIASGDLVDYQSTGSYTLALVATTFSATTNTAIRMLACGNGTSQTFTTAGGTGYPPIGGGYMGAGALGSDTGAQTTIRSAGTLKNGIANVSANSGSTGATFTSRINSGSGVATGNIAIVVSTSTGIFEDTSHMDNVSSGYLVNLQLTMGATSPNATFIYAGVDYTTTGGSVPQIHFDPQVSDQTISSATNAFFQMGAGYATAESGSAGGAGQVSTRDTFTYSNMESYVTTNTIAASSTVTFTATSIGNTNITFPISSTGTGFFSDTTHTYVATATDLVVTELSVGTSAGNSLAPASFVVWASLPVGTLYTRSISETVGHGNVITGSG